MGRRSQKSRAGQAKDRAKRAASESENSDDNSSVVEKSDGEKDDDIADKSSGAESADDDNGDDTAEGTPDERVADSEAGDDTADNATSEDVDSDSEAGDDTADNATSEDVDSDSEAGDDTADNVSSEDVDSDDAAGVDTPQGNAADDALDGELADDMAAGYASIEADQNPQTCCPNCRTIFEVSPELLSSADTRVRCGECLGIFDALANFRHQDGRVGGENQSESSHDGAQDGVEQVVSGGDGRSAAESDSKDSTANGSAADAISLDVTYADFSLFSADAALPEIDYLDDTVEVQSFDFDDQGGDDELDDTYSETLFAHGPEVDARSAIHETDAGNAENEASITAGAADDGNSPAAKQTTADGTAANFDTTLSETHTGDELDELVGSLRRSESDISVQDRPVSSWWLRSALSLLVLLLAAGLYGYRERESLQHSRYLRPMLEPVCSMIGCTLAEPVDLASLQVLKRSVFSHPKLNNVLVINIGFVNKASFNQRFPVLEIRLTDRNGGLVVKNSFEPSDYLDNWQPGDVLDAGKRLDISLNVKDPGNKAISFELDFR